MGHRSDRLRIRADDAAATKVVNRKSKVKERARRDARMVERIKEGGLPYTPEVMSWLSVRLNKRSACITDQDVKSLLAP